MDKMISKPSCNLVNLVDKEEGFSFPRRTRSVTKKTKPLCSFVNSVDRVVFFFALLVFLLPFPTSSLAQEFTATTIGDFGNVAVMEVTGNYDAKNPDGSINSIPRQEIAKEFFKTHRDECDFLVIFSNFNFQMPETEAKAFYHTVKNDTLGIGQPLFDNSDLFGSSGKLQGTIDMGNVANLVLDPLAPQFEETLRLMAHEHLHRWGAYVKFKDSNGAISEALLGRDKKHWSFLLDSSASVIYGNKWQDNGNGTFTSVDGSKYYSPLDLYLMGFYGKSQVPPMLLIENPNIDPTRLPVIGVTINGTPRYVSIDDIIAAEGERIPNVSGAQKSFKTAFIFITSPGTFTADALYGIEELRGAWLTRFSILTDGQAIVDVALTPKGTIPTNPGLTEPPFTPRTLPPNIDDAVRWLINNQRPNGSWMDLSQTEQRDTAGAVFVLKNFDFAQENYINGLQWLNGIYSGNMDYLSRKIETFVQSGQDVAALVNELLSRQNPDGGWGSNKSYVSNPMDTSFALRILALTGYQDQTVLPKAIEYLKTKQNADGGWGIDDEGSSIQATANVLSAFNRYRKDSPLEDPITNGLSWLLQRQNLDGGFGQSPSTVYDTAVTILTLKELGASNEVIGKGVQYILNLQSEDGSWYKSPFQTAMAVQAVWKVTIDPDLSIKTGDITITPSSITSLPSDIVITAIAQNLGRTDVAQVKAVLYDGAVSDANKVGEQVLAIPGQSSVTVTFSLTIRDGNEHLFYIVIDPENHVTESDKTNNTAAKALNSETTYDFEILSSDVSVSPNPVDMLHDVRINSKIRNKGTMNAYNVQIRYYIDDAGGPFDIATSTVDIPANSTLTNEVIWRATKAGQNLPVTVLVDPFNLFDEISKANNKAVAYLSVNALTDPNLVVSYQDIVMIPSPVNERGSVNISALVKNDGFSQASNIVVNFYKGIPGQDGVLLGSQTIPSLNAGESIRVSINWTNIMESGEKIIYVQADPPNQINEIREDDNSAFTTLKILSLPDFAVSTNSITFNPPAPKDGDTVAINVTVQNKGEQGASNLLVRASEGATVIGSQVIPSISGNSQAVASFTYNTTGKSGPHQITVAVDPDNTILEQSEDNNQASRAFGVQSADLWLTEPYISPNGDSVKDSTQFFFRLDNPQTVKIAVVNEKDETVRLFSGGEFENTSGGNVTWDGKNDNGVVVADGDYQIQVLDPNNNNLGSLLLVVDNNQSPLVKAIGTKYLLNKNLSCMLTDFWNWESPYSNLTWFPDESGVLLQISSADQNTPEYPTGTYSMGPDGEDILRLIPWEWRRNLDPKYDYCIGSCGYSEYPDYDLSPDGEKVAFVLNKYNRLTYRNNYELSQIWVMDRDGRNLTLLDSYTILQNSPTLDNVTWAPDGSYIGYRHLPSTGSELWIIKPDGTGKTKVAASNTYITNFFWSRGSNKIVYIAYADNSYRLKIWLTDIAGNIVDISRVDGYDWIDGLKIEWLNNEKIIFAENDNYDSYKLWLVDVMENSHLKVSESTGGYEEFVSEPDGKSFAFTESINDLPSMRISDEMGNTRVIHNSKSVGYYGSPLYDLRWSKDGSKLAFIDRTYEKFNEPVYNNDLDECIYNSYLIVFDLKTEEKKAFKVSDALCLCCGGSYHVQTIEGGSWVERGLLSYDSTYKTKELDLTSYLNKQTSPYQIRISQQGKDAAHIDHVALSVDGRQYAPTKALDTSTGEDILNKVILKDNDVADVHNSTTDFIWENVPMGKRISLVLNAREEDLKIRKTIPFRYPKINYYTFRIDQSGPVNVDGQITPEDNLSQPLFKEYTRPVTGHPEGYTFGYIKTDGEHLYGVLDFTSDNTMDYGKDWASIEILTPDGTKTFLINDSQQQYGRASLTYTQAVNYQHMVYEFKIPLREIGAKEGDTINIAFNAYGTAAGDGDNYLYYTDGSLQWHPDNISIYAEDYSGVFVINIEDEEKTYLPVIEGYSVGISPLGRYITYYQSVDPLSVCYGRGYIDLWAISSLLNLTADLRIKKEKSAIILRGSAVDLNFEGHVLEYADAKSPTVWNLVAPASNVSVIDDVFTTWVPPYEGIFYVRLSVWDKAGNVAWDRKRVSWGLSASITNLYKTLEYFSPNEDGVKDTVELHYKVLEPVHLEFNIYDENNNLKRTFLKDYTNPGDDLITWDGKDENGGVVPDGTYKIKVFDYEFFVKVDSTPPDVNIVLGDMYFEDKMNMVSVNLTGHAVDQYIEHWVIEYGEGDNPQEWYEYLRGEDILVARDEEGNPILDPIGDKLIRTFAWTDITWLVGKKLRITAEDFAGNRTTAITEFLEEKIILNKWDMNFIWGFIPDDLAIPGQHNLAGLETIRLPVVSLNVQYMQKVNQWVDGLPIIDSPSVAFNVEWDNSFMGPEEGFSVRLRAVDILGQEHYTNILSRDRFELNSYCKAPNLVAFNILQEELKLMVFQMKESGGSAWADYWVLDSSKGDSIPTGKFYPPTPSVQPGSNYLINMVGVGVSGKQYYSMAIYPPACLQLRVVPDEAECGVVSNKAKLEAEINPEEMPSLENISLKTLGYYIEKPEGLQILRQFDLTTEGWGSVTIDTSQMSEGSYPVEAILSYVDLVENTNNETTGSNNLIVDRILPNAQITYPGTSLRVCPVRVSDPKGDWYGIPVEGMAADNTQVKKYTLYWGVGENPSGWMEAYTRRLGERKLISGTESVTGNIATWDITGLKGETYSLMLKVTDVSGNVSCHTTSFSFDHVVEITSLATDKTLFSPNGDDILDDVIVNYGIDEYARVDVKVFKLLESQDGTYSLDSTPVRTIISGQQHLGGTETTSWDGKDDSGAVVPDGRYGIAVFATDSCGNTNMRWTPAEVDNTPPTTIITYPQPSDPLGNIVEVKGTADDLHFLNYTLEAGQGDDPETWNLASSDTKSVNNHILGKWNTFGLDGRWTLRLSATDTVGNKNETTVSIDLGERKTLIKDLSANPGLFSPNNDGKLDTTRIDYEVTDACNMTMEIFDSAGAARKTYTTVTPSEGIYAYIWDGRDNAGALIPDGIYTVKFTAALSSNPSLTQSETVTLVVDSTPPLTDIKQPLNNSYLKTDVTVNGTISDTNIKEYSVAYAGDSGAGAIDQGSQNRVNYTFGIINELAEGNYALSVKAKDLAENNVEQNIAFVIDRTPPKVSLDAPKEGEYYGSDKNTIAVTGAVVEKSLDTYSVRYGSGDNPTQWTDLLTGNTVPANPQLFIWKVGKNDGIPDGLYTLSLFAKDKAGLTGEAKVKVTVDNTPPETAITSPADGGYVRAAVDINGTAFDQNLEKYVFELSEGQCTSAYKWAPIKTSTTSVRNGVIASWHALPPDGEYCLRVTASDKIGNKSEARVNVKVDTQPPAPPALSGNIENKSSSRLTWTASSEPDLSGYNLYRDAKKVNTALINDTNYLDQNLKEGIYAYTATAVDLAGNESKPSNQVKLTVDTTPPNVRISSPQDNSWVSGLVDIKGTAYSADDFKEYRVSIGQGSAPSAWNLTRTSPLSTSYGSLAPWDTIGLPEGIYSIKLEAEDLTGNINTHQVSVNLDNTPPRAPVLLTATATGSDVTLTWQANPEADLAGYLLYRNDQLANVSGNVIGNLKPYLIAGTSYLNKAIPDGKSRYYLIAMDLAGNMSDQSNTLEVDIDTRPPHATIVEPPDKLKFQANTFVRAESPDTDIASVQFQYKRAQDTTWINLSGPATESPYTTYVDPISLGFTHGDYHLRAVATDLGAKTDPSPSFITVTYTDVTPPEAPKDLKALTIGSGVTLTWTANTETDLDGYNIYRTSESSRTKVNSAVVKTATYQDNGLADASYTYEVTAIDTYGNESKPSNSTSARVYAPLIQQPYTPTGKNVLDIRGSNSTASASVEITIEPVSGSVLRVMTPADPAGNFNSNNVPLTLGENRITAKATDSSGNVSRSSDLVVVVYNEPPSAPTGLTASVSGNDMVLTWNPNTEPDLSGYNLYRDGGRLNLPIKITPTEGTITSSESYNSPSLAFDSTPGTFWDAYVGYDSPLWWEIDLTTPELINHVEIHWGSDNSQGNEVLYAGKEYEIQVWSGYAWISQTKVTGNNTKDNTFDFKPSYRTDKIRIYVSDSTDPSGQKGVLISEVGILKDVLITQPSYVDSVASAKSEIHTFKVTAVDYYGFESAPSEEATAEFGDSTPPSPPQNLTATATGANVALTWSPNSEADLAGYNIYRNTPQGWIKINSILVIGAAYIDPNLPNGNYTYHVTAVDLVGNESLPSNEATATVQDLIPPSRPEIFFPTSYGLPITLFRDKTDISGIADPGSIVTLYKNAIPGVSTVALTTDQTMSFNGEFLGSVSPDGRALAYEDPDGFVSLLTLATGDRRQISEGYGYYPQWSPNGEKLAYLSYDDTNGQTRIGIYDVIKESSLPFNGGTETSNEIDLSWSYDGNKIAFISDRGGTLDAWLLDLSSGSTTQVTSGLDLYTLRLSPDGKKIACSVSQSIFVKDLVNGNTIEADTNAEPWYFEWAPDSTRLAFASYRNGNADIFVLDMETQVQTQVTNSGGDELYPIWSPDGRSIAYQEFDTSGNNSIEIASLQTIGQQRILKENLYSLYYVSWLRSGRIAYIDPIGLKMISLVGHFSFGDVSLDPGENIFYVTAMDAGGNVSPSSDEIYVNSNPQFPDLEIMPEDIFIYPATPIVGEEVAVTVLYRNKGQIEAKDVKLEIYLWDSGGNVKLVKSENIPLIDPGSEGWVDLSLNTTGMTGTNQIIAVIDPEDNISEALEDNNDAILEFFVAAQEGLFMTTALDSAQYHSKQDVNIMVNLKNSGAEKAVTLEVRVEDENGFTVALADTIHENLPYASDKDYGVIWHTGLTFSGVYRVHTILKEGTIIRAENTVAFTILPDTNIQTTVVTDKAGYRPNENVVITITVRNGGENAPISELKTITRILDAGGQELFKEEDAIKNLLPGGISSLNLSWNTGLHPVGDYNVLTETFLNNQLVTSKSALFRIDTSFIITGSLHVTPSIILVGNTGQAEYVLKNEGNVDMNGLLVRLLVVDPETQVTLATHEETIDLGIGASRNGTWSFSTEGYSLKTYVLILQSIYQGNTKPIANASFSVKGGTPHILVSPQSLDFGNINLGSASTQTITLSSTGNADLMIGTIALSGTNQGEFSKQNDTCSGRPIAPSGSCTLDVLFSPTSLEVKSASLFIPSNATEMPILYLPLGGKGITNLNVSINPTSSGRVTGTGIDCPGDCAESFSTSGATIQLTATPTEGYRFVNWTGDINSPENPVTITMDTHKNVMANFAINTYTITTTASLGGTITPSGSTTVNYGASQTFTMTPNSGYHVADVKVDGIPVGARTTYTFDNVNSNHTIEVTFEIDNTPPVADAGLDQNVITGQVVTLNGSKSFDPEGVMITFLWTFVEVPAESSVTNASLSDVTSAKPEFTPDVNGAYRLQLIVNDGALNSVPDEVLINATTPNVAPNANAGPDQNVYTGNSVQLDGSRSSDPDNGPLPLSYLWGFAAKPAGSLLTDNAIANRDLPNASFIPDVDGLYELILTINDGNLSSEDTVQIMATIPNVPPNANAGADMTIYLGNAAVLDGSASNDPDHGPQPLAYLWSFVAVPTGSQLTNGHISGANTVSPSFTPDVEGTYVLQLMVYDGIDAGFDNVAVTVTQNQPPNAAPTGGGVYEVNTPITLGGQVSDFDGDLITYEWLEGNQILYSGQIGTIYGGSPVNLPEQTISLGIGTHVITLRVSDGFNLPVTSDITIQVIDTSAPILAPVPDKTILWPPNHKMVDITIWANASDNTGNPVVLAAVVSSNEPENGLGDGDTSPDWTEPVIDQINGIITLQLRSERSGTGNGRIYTITITGTDASGNSSQANVEIKVPHDKGNK